MSKARQHHKDPNRPRETLYTTWKSTSWGKNFPTSSRSRECDRRKLQIENGELKAENGLCLE